MQGLLQTLLQCYKGTSILAPIAIGVQANKHWPPHQSF